MSGYQPGRPHDATQYTSSPSPAQRRRSPARRSLWSRQVHRDTATDLDPAVEGGAVELPHIPDPHHSPTDISFSFSSNYINNIDSTLPFTSRPHSRPPLSTTSSAYSLASSSTLTTLLNNSFRRRWTNRNRKLRLLPQFLSLPRSNTLRMFLLLALVFIGGVIHYLWKSEKAMNKPWVPDPSSLLFAQRPLPRPIETSFLSAPLAPTPDSDGAHDDKTRLGGHSGQKNNSDSTNRTTVQYRYALPLRTLGRNIVDQDNRRFKLSSVNWYGASDELFIPGGLDVQHRSTIAAAIRSLGFNSVRLPYSDEMVMSNPTILPHLLTANPDLVGLRALEIFAKCVKALTDAGIAVIINNHITSATWCCGGDPCDSGWSNDHLGPLCRVRQSEDEWIEHWLTVMDMFVDNPLVIGADLRNEVRGLWGTMPWDRWAAAAERAGNELLKLNSDWLIVVGGTESANDLRGVARRPIKLDVDNRVVYSAHVYAWSGWGSREGRFAKRSYPSFVAAMRTNWAYLVEGNEAPVWIGEFGAPNQPSQGDANYWANLMRYLKAINADFGYWAINPRKPKDDEKESYSLVEDDWVTPLLDYRMKDMSELMRIPSSLTTAPSRSSRASKDL